MSLLKIKRIRLIYIIGIALLLASLCTGILAVPQVYAGSPSGSRHAAADSGGGSGTGGGGDSGSSGNSGTPIALEEVPVDDAGGDDSGNSDEGGTTATLPDSDEGVTITSDKEDYAPYETPVLTGSGYAPNSTVEIMVMAPDGTVTSWTAQTDDQGQFTTTYDGTLDAGTFTVAATDGAVTSYTSFTDATYYYFKYDGLDGDCPGNEVVVVISLLGIPYDWVHKSEMEGSSGYYAGKFRIFNPSWNYTDFITSSVDGKRYANTGESVSTSGSNKTVTGYYTVQYMLTVQSENGVTGGAGWYNSGDTAYATLNTGSIYIPYDTDANFINWTVGGSDYGSNYALSNPISMTAPRTAIANWHTAYYLTVDSAYGTAGGEGWYDSGDYAYATLDTGLVDGGTPGVNDIRYKFDDWDDDASGSNYASSNAIHMTSAKHALADWDTQYYLLVNNGGHSTTYGTDWYDAGDKAYFGVNDSTVYDGADTRYKFDQWDGEGCGSYDGSDPTHYVYMNGPITETATWNTQYHLTVSDGGHGGITVGDGWYDEGETAYAYISEPFTVNGGIPLYDDVRYIYLGWGGDATGDNRDYLLFIEYSESDPIVMDGPKTAIAQWQTQYYLDVRTYHGSTYGSGWYNEGADATFGVTSTIVPDGDGKRYEFDNWFGLPCGAYNGTDPEYTIQMTTHFIETACYTAQYRLIMYSEINDYSGTYDGGATDPAVGEHWYDEGTWVQIQAYAPASVDGERYTWNGWTGTPQHCCPCMCSGYTGDGEGTTHSAWIEMNCPITETASWDHEYRLTMESYVTDATGTVAGGTTDPSVGEHWYLAGTPLDITAYAPALSYAEGERYTFDGWDGSGCGSYTGMDINHGITMNSPITQASTWLHEYQLTMEANYGTTDPALGTHWYLAGTNVPILAIEPVAEPFETYGWNGWTGTGCGSYTGTDNPSAVNMFSPITQTASWLYVPPGGAESPDERTGLVIVIDVEGTIASYPVTPDGALLVDVNQMGPDGNLTLSIPEGTIVLNPDGTPAYQNPDPDVIGIRAGAVASADVGNVVQAYDLTPTGLYFVNGEATLTAKYNSDNVPEGTNVTWAFYNADSGTWTDVETSGTVAADGEPLAACNTTSLTTFALIAK